MLLRVLSSTPHALFVGVATMTSKTGSTAMKIDTGVSHPPVSRQKIDSKFIHKSIVLSLSSLNLWYIKRAPANPTLRDTFITRISLTTFEVFNEQMHTYSSL